MASIPSWFWLIAGIAVIFFSKYVGGKIEFFFWIGLVFAIIGLAKILVGYIMKKGETKTEQRAENSPFYPSAAPAASQPASMQAQTMRFCPRCGGQVPPTSYFCHKCGLRLK